MRIYLLLLLLFLGSTVYAQTVILEEEVPTIEEDTMPGNFGPNRKHFLTPYYTIAAAIPTAGVTGVKFPSVSFNMGLRYKLQWSRIFSSGIEINYFYHEFVLKDQNYFINPTVDFEKEKVNSQGVSGGIYQRINFGKRGNIIGKYLDVGLSGDLITGRQYVTKEIVEYDQEVHTVTKKFRYLETTGWNIFGRLGTNFIALYGKYRMSSLIAEEFSFADFPKLFIGLEITMR